MTDVIADSRFRAKTVKLFRGKEKPLGAKGPPMPRPIPKPRPKSVLPNLSKSPIPDGCTNESGTTH